jgi:hypothetical protein
MPATYEPIATNTVTTTVATVTFSSIPGTYTDLILVMAGKTTTGTDVYVRINSDTSTNYSFIVLSGTGTASNAGKSINNDGGILTDSYGWVENNNKNITITQFMNYSNATTYKTVLSRANNGGSTGGVDLIAATWRNTAAITSLTLRSASSFVSGSTATLYGIKVA